MKKIVLLCFLMGTFMFQNAFAIEDNAINNSVVNEEKATTSLVNDIQLQKRISDIGYKILNANKIESRMIFVYEKQEKLVKVDPALLKRQIIMYDKNINFASDENEVAAFLSREICKAADANKGAFRGFLSSVQIKSAPKKYERFCDKRAVDYMVMAGYNPVALITYINKSCPQKRYDVVSRKNLTSKRLANIYEYIYTKYPYFLANNEYLYDEAYQNFLLTSVENRKKLQEKIKSGSKKAVKYE